MGLLLHAIVHSAGIQDRDGGIALLATLFGRFPFLEKLFADGAYQGLIFGNALAKIFPYLETEIVRRSDQAKGFVRLPKRWIVERTIAWLNRCRRLAKDWENLNRNALAFLQHQTDGREFPKSRAMLGRPTFTTKRSRLAIIIPTETMAST
jgi:putative transposase